MRLSLIFLILGSLGTIPVQAQQQDWQFLWS